MTLEARRAVYRRGLRAEHLAAIFLRFKGYGVLERRFKTPVGEIDLVARRGKTLIFVEVKERNDMRTALESISPQMKSRINRAALYYLAAHPEFQGFDMRFDVVATSGLRIRHLDNAWSAAA